MVDHISDKHGVEVNTPTVDFSAFPIHDFVPGKTHAKNCGVCQGSQKRSCHPKKGNPSHIMNLQQISKADLLAELERRVAIEEDLAYQKRVSLWTLVIKNLDSLLETLEHSKTSCNDYNLSNAYCQDNGQPRCRRCYLLEQTQALNRAHQPSIRVLAEEFAKAFDVKVDIEFIPVK